MVIASYKYQNSLSAVSLGRLIKSAHLLLGPTIKSGKIWLKCPLPLVDISRTGRCNIAVEIEKGWITLWLRGNRLFCMVKVHPLSLGKFVTLHAAPPVFSHYLSFSLSLHPAHYCIASRVHFCSVCQTPNMLNRLCLCLAVVHTNNVCIMLWCMKMGQ